MRTAALTGATARTALGTLAAWLLLLLLFSGGFFFALNNRVKRDLATLIPARQFPPLRDLRR